MAAKKAKAAGEAKAAATWTPEVKPEVKDELEIPSFVVKFATVIAQIRSLVATATGGMSGASEINIGDSVAQSEGIAVKLASAAAITWTGTLNLLFTAATTVTISLGGHKLAANIIFKGAGKYKLEEAIKCAAQIRLEEGASLETNAQAGEASYFQLLGTSVLAATGTTFTITAASTGEGWHVEPTATLSGSPSVLFTDTSSVVEHQFGGGSKTYGTITFVSWTKVEQSNTVATWNANSSAAPTECKATLATNMMTVTSGEANVFAGAEVTGTALPIGTTIIKKVSAGVWELSANATETVGVAETITIIYPGVVVTEATTQTVTTLASNGTVEKPARVASTKAGKAWTLKLPGNVETQGVLRVKDTTVTGGILYVPNGVDLGGNTNVKFEHQPATLAQSLGIKDAITGRKVTPQALVSVVALKGTTAGSKATKGAIATSVGISSGMTTAKSASGVVAQVMGLSAFLKGNKATGLSAAQRFGLLSRILGELGGIFLVGNTTAYPVLEHHVINWAGGFPGASQFTAATSGTVTQLLFLAGPEESSCTSLFLGLFAEGSNAPTGAPLASGELAGKPVASQWGSVNVSAAKAQVIAGTKYWLAWLPIGGSVNMVTAVNSGGSLLIEDGSGKTKMEAFEWGGTAEVGPASIAAFGTEGAGPISEAFAQMLGLVSALTGRKVSSTATAQSIGVASAATGRKSASAGLLQQTALRSSVLGAKRALTATASSIGTVSALVGSKASGAVSTLQALGLRGTQATNKSTPAQLHQQTAINGTITTRKSARGETVTSVGIQGTSTATKSTHAATANTLGLAGSPTGRKGTLAAAANSFGLTGTSNGGKRLLSALSTAIGVQGATGGRKGALSSFVNTVGSRGSVTSRKATTGAVKVAVGFSTRIGWTTRRSGGFAGRFGLLGRLVGAVFAKPEAGTVDLVDTARSTVTLTDASIASATLMDSARGTVELTDEPADPR